MLEYKRFEEIISSSIFNDLSFKLLESLADNPERFTSRYRLSTPSQKLVQYLSQSIEIKFGNTLEKIFKEYFIECGVNYLERRSVDNTLDFDHLFLYNNKIVLVEQKIRDDHDSTKKVGQVENYFKKLDYIKKMYPNYEIISVMWFIDDSMSKNRNYYIEKIGLDHLIYGEKMSGILDSVNPNIAHIDIWDNFHNNLKRYKEELDSRYTYIFNCEDKNIDYSLLGSTAIKNLLSNDIIIKEIFPIITPTMKLVKDLEIVLNNKPNSKYKKEALLTLESFKEKYGI